MVAPLREETTRERMPSAVLHLVKPATPRLAAVEKATVSLERAAGEH
jgi:hypothetical protein